MENNELIDRLADIEQRAGVLKDGFVLDKDIVESNWEKAGLNEEITKFNKLFEQLVYEHLKKEKEQSE